MSVLFEKVENGEFLDRSSLQGAKQCPTHVLLKKSANPSLADISKSKHSKIPTEQGLGKFNLGLELPRGD